MHEIRSFKIFQTAKVIAVLYAISFAIVAVFQLLAFKGMGSRKPPLMVILSFPILGAIFSFITTAFLCWLYNQIAARVGGIAFELTPRNENSPN
jgi:hypothetical protein